MTLRESGSIEQDADLVGLLVRQEYYADTDEEKDETGRQKPISLLPSNVTARRATSALTFIKEFTALRRSCPRRTEPM